VSEQRLHLFAVQCGPSERQASTFCVPALNPDEAVVRARAVADKCIEEGVPNPFEEAGAKVRIGTFDPVHKGKINYGDWQLP
jgi:hypothetical protein